MWGTVHALMYKWISVRFMYGYWCSLSSIGIVVFTTMLQHHLSMVIFSLYFSCSEKLVLQFWRYWKLMLFLFYTYRYRSVLAVKLWQPSISVKLIPLLCVCFIVGKYGTIMYELYSIVLCLCLDNCSLYVISLLHLSWSMRFLSI